jgi:DNA modification methylase
MTGQALVVRADARRLPLADASVDLIVTSPPYFALRSYRDECDECGGSGSSANTAADTGRAIANTSEKSLSSSTLGGGRQASQKLGASLGRAGGERCGACSGTGAAHYDGQVGSEPTPGVFLDALIECTREMVRVVKPSGSIWLNLGDKYAGGGGQWEKDERPDPGRRRAVSGKIASGGKTWGIPEKSRMLLPHRYAIRCIDELGLICRMDMVWSKPNGLPESVTDRVRASHEYWFHLVREPRYFSAIDEIREPHAAKTLTHRGGGESWGNGNNPDNNWANPKVREVNPLGRLPGSVWTIPTEPLSVPDDVRAHYDLPDHFAAFAQEWPRRLILGWSPSGICVECGEGRRPVVDSQLVGGSPFTGRDYRRLANGPTGGPERPMPGGRNDVTITGYACACPPVGNPAPTRPSVVVDPFGGTGTVAGVARQLGRIGISVDLSMGYSRLARWRVFKSGHFTKSEQRTWADRQQAML